MNDFDILKQQGFSFIKKLSNGTYVAQHNKTTYYGLYVEAGKIRQQ
jgi:hypothetical protein